MQLLKQFPLLPGFREKIIGAGGPAACPDRFLVVARKYQHPARRTLLLDPAQHVQPAACPQGEIEDDRIRLVQLEGRHGFRRGSNRADQFQTRHGANGLREDFPQGKRILDDEELQTRAVGWAEIWHGPIIA
jgi:hypothetical protein